MLILFDIDDTLINHSVAFRAATVALHQLAGSSLTVEEFIALASTVHRRFFDRYLKGELTYVQQSRARLRALIDPTLSDDNADQFFTGYLSHYEAAWELLPDVQPCLDKLSRCVLA